MGSGCLAMGIDYIVAVVCKLPHIVLVDQSASHQKMNPDDIVWDGFNKKEWIAVGLLFGIIGLVGVVGGILYIVGVF